VYNDKLELINILTHFFTIFFTYLAEVGVFKNAEDLCQVSVGSRIQEEEQCPEQETPLCLKKRMPANLCRRLVK
jgi:hypothetical protein